MAFLDYAGIAIGIVFDIFLLWVMYRGVRRFFALLRDIKTTKKLIKENTEIQNRKDISFGELIIAKIRYSALSQELMMAHSRPRGDALFWIGIILLIFSLAIPAGAARIYINTSPISSEIITQISNLKKDMGELPKDFPIPIGRDWHLLLGGITFGFLCLAAAKGILSQQASEMKAYFEMGQRVRYFERLISLVELILNGQDDISKQEKAALSLVHEKLLYDFQGSKGEETKASDEAPANLLSEVLKATQSIKPHAA